MIGQKKQPKKEISKWAYAFVPASLSIGIALGFALSYFVTKKAVITQKEIAAEIPEYTSRDGFSKIVLAIDNELRDIKNADYRRVLVDCAYKLIDLDLRAHLPKSISPSELKQVPLLVNTHPSQDL